MIKKKSFHSEFDPDDVQVVEKKEGKREGRRQNYRLKTHWRLFRNATALPERQAEVDLKAYPSVPLLSFFIACCLVDLIVGSLFLICGSTCQG